MLKPLFLEIVNMSASASWLVLAVLILRGLLRRSPKWVSCALWGMVALRLICPVALESEWSLVPISATRSAVDSVMDDYVGPSHSYWDITEEYQIAVNAGMEPISGGDGDTYVVTGETPEEKPTLLSDILAPIWLAGVGFLLTYGAAAYLRLRWRVSASIELDKGIYLCDYIQTPFILGFIRPRIYLPSDMDACHSIHVLAHERAHIRRKDHWWKPLGFLLLAIHWFNPLMWVAYICLCRDIELACDEKVIQRLDMEDKKAYSEALLSCSMPRHLITACPLAFGEVGVKARVKSVLDYKKPAFWIVLIAIIVSIIVGICFLTNPVPPLEATHYTLDAVVLRTYENSMLVAQADDAPNGQYWINAAPDGIRVGDTLQIDHDGMVAETYPVQINTVYDIRVVDRIMSDEILSQIYQILGTENVSFFDYQEVDHSVVIGCEYAEGTALVFMQERDGKLEIISIPSSYSKNYWVTYSPVEANHTYYVICDTEIVALCIPGQEDSSYIRILNYPAVIAVEDGYKYEPVLAHSASLYPEDIYGWLEDPLAYVDNCFATVSSSEIRPGSFSLREDEFAELINLLTNLPEEAVQPADTVEYGNVSIILSKHLGGSSNIYVELDGNGERVWISYFLSKRDGDQYQQRYTIQSKELAVFISDLYDPDRRESYFSSMAIPGVEPVTCDYGYAGISVPYWDYWEYEFVESPTDNGDWFGIRMKPKEEEGWLLVSYWPGVFAVCGTGLDMREFDMPTFAGRTFTAGYYDGSEDWSFIIIPGEYGDFVIRDDGASQWLDYYEAALNSILYESVLQERS